MTSRESREPEGLKPCPFCGSDALITVLDGATRSSVYCNDCYCHGPACHTDAEALADWNRRVPAAPAGAERVERWRVDGVVKGLVTDALPEEHFHLHVAAARYNSLCDRYEAARAEVAALQRAKYGTPCKCEAWIASALEAEAGQVVAEGIVTDVSFSGRLGEYNAELKCDVRSADGEPFGLTVGQRVRVVVVKGE